jgi:hypothetical protein
MEKTNVREFPLLRLSVVFIPATSHSPSFFLASRDIVKYYVKGLKLAGAWRERNTGEASNECALHSREALFVSFRCTNRKILEERP